MCVRMCVHVVRLQHACIPVNFIQLHIHRMPMQCQLYNPVGANQGLRLLHGCESLFLHSFASRSARSALPAAGGRGVKVQAERGGAFSLLVTSNNNYFSLPPP